MATRIGEETIKRIESRWGDLIAAVADGSNIGTVCASIGVSRDQVRVYRLMNPEAMKDWDLAREQSADAFADQVLEIGNNPGADSRSARVKLQALMWLAAKRNPRQYSDKSSIDLNVKTVDLTKIIQDANARLAASQAGRVIEGVVLHKELEDLL